MVLDPVYSLEIESWLSVIMLLCFRVHLLKWRLSTIKVQLRLDWSQAGLKLNLD